MRRSIWLGLVLAAVAGIVPAASAAASPHQAGAPAARVEGRVRTGRGSVQSTNWSGYAAYGTRFTSANGSWVQPAADCSAVSAHHYAIAAFWVGLDGYESNTVEQIGTESDCVGGEASYGAWYELYPERPFPIGGKVEPNDTLHAEVTQDTLKLEDTTQKWSAEEPFLPRSLAFSSADWIAEAPVKNRLTPFGKVSFTGAAASTGSVSGGAIDDEAWSNDAITLVGNGGSILAEPGALEAGGKAFTITAAPQEPPSKGKSGEHGKPH